MHEIHLSWDVLNVCCLPFVSDWMFNTLLILLEMCLPGIQPVWSGLITFPIRFWILSVIIVDNNFRSVGRRLKGQNELHWEGPLPFIWITVMVASYHVLGCSPFDNSQSQYLLCTELGSYKINFGIHRSLVILFFNPLMASSISLSVTVRVISAPSSSDYLVRFKLDKRVLFCSCLWSCSDES